MLKKSRRKTNMEITSLCSPRSGNPVPNQYVIRKGNVERFKSYSTIVAKREGNKITLDNDIDDYTLTTMRYLNVFLDASLTKADVRKILAHKGSERYHVGRLN